MSVYVDPVKRQYRQKMPQQAFGLTFRVIYADLCIIALPAVEEVPVVVAAQVEDQVAEVDPVVDLVEDLAVEEMLMMGV